MPNEMEKTVQSDASCSKPNRPLSRPALVSFVFALCSLLPLALMLIPYRSLSPFWEGVLGVVMYFLVVTPLIAATTALITLFDLRGKRHLIRGSLLALTAIVIAVVVVAFYGLSVAWAFHNHFRGDQLCGVGNSILVYMEDNSGRFPEPGRWCDLLVENADLHPNSLMHRGKGCYAFNDQVTLSSPNDIVVVFESKPGWNQHGGRELLSLNWYWPRGAFVMRKDFTVEYIWPRHVDSLRWSPDSNSQP